MTFATVELTDCYRAIVPVLTVNSDHAATLRRRSVKMEARRVPYLKELLLVAVVAVSVDALSQESVKLLQRLHLEALRSIHGPLEDVLKYATTKTPKHLEKPQSQSEPSR